MSTCSVDTLQVTCIPRGTYAITPACTPTVADSDFLSPASVALTARILGGSARLLKQQDADTPHFDAVLDAILGGTCEEYFLSRISVDCETGAMLHVCRYADLQEVAARYTVPFQAECSVVTWADTFDGTIAYRLYGEKLNQQIIPCVQEISAYRRRALYFRPSCCYRHYDIVETQELKPFSGAELAHWLHDLRQGDMRNKIA